MSGGLPSFSSIPGAVTSLIAVFQTALAASPQQSLVWFGQALGAYSAPLTLQVLRVTGDQEPAELGPSYRREEVFAIDCQLSSFAGDNDHAARMAEVFAAFGLVAGAIGNNPTLSGTVRYAEVGNFNYEPEAGAMNKSLGSLAFAVRCSQRVTSLN